jgi:hypothetical protein
LFDAYEAWREINVHEPWERTRLLAYYMGNHKASKPEQLFPLEIDTIRLKEQIEKGKVSFATIREQTPEEQELMKKLNRG